MLFSLILFSEPQYRPLLLLIWLSYRGAGLWSAIIIIVNTNVLSLKQVCKNSPRIRDTDHLFIELPLLKDKLEEYINKTSVTGSWSQNAIQTTNAWLRDGLRQRCITRDLKWGVPVPHEKYKDKVSTRLLANLINIKTSTTNSNYGYRSSTFGLMLLLDTFQ